MRRHVLGSALVLGSLLVGCGVRPAALSTTPVAPALTQAQAAKGSLAVKKVLMPPLAVFKTADDQVKNQVNWLKQNGAKFVSVSPVMNTVKLSVNGETAGYFVAAHGNAIMAKDGKTEAYKAFLWGYLIDAKGQLSFSYGLGASSKADSKKSEQPTRTVSKKIGDLHLRMPEGDKLPPEIEAKLNALHEAEQGTIADHFPYGLTMFPTDPQWWNFGTCELWYKGAKVGYWDDPAAWMWDKTDTGMTTKAGFMALNVLDAAGNRQFGEAQAINPENLMGYKSFAL